MGPRRVPRGAPREGAGAMSALVRAEPVRPERTWAQAFVERAKREIAQVPTDSAVSYVSEAGSTLVAFAEGGTTGAVLGAAHATFGLDTKAGPVDGWVALMGAAASVVLAGHMPFVADRARGVGAQAFGVLAFRRAYE